MTDNMNDETPPVKRLPLSAKTRFEVFKRDLFTCQYCGAHPPTAILHVDHIHPVAEGGTNDEDNLVTSCDRCNFGKGARLLSSAPKSLADKADDAKEREEQLAGYAAVMQAIRDRIETDTWEVLDAVIPGSSEGTTTARFESVKRFVKEIGKFACLEASDIAWGKNPYSDPQRFKYFCGVCWRKIERGDF